MSDWKTCHPHIVDHKQMKHFDRFIMPKIVGGCVVKNGGLDLMTHVYLTGLYHGTLAMKEIMERTSDHPAVDAPIDQRTGLPYGYLTEVTWLP